MTSVMSGYILNVIFLTTKSLTNTKSILIPHSVNNQFNIAVKQGVNYTLETGIKYSPIEMDKKTFR